MRNGNIFIFNRFYKMNTMNTTFILYDIDSKYYKLSDLRFIFMIIKSKYYQKLITVYKLYNYYIEQILTYCFR